MKAYILIIFFSILSSHIFCQDQYTGIYNQAIYDVRNNECDSAIKKFNFLFKNSLDNKILKNSYIFNSQCLRKMGLYSESMVSINKAITIDPNDLASYFDKIHILNKTKGYSQIITICDSILNTKVSNAIKLDCYYYLGKSNAIIGNSDSAIKYCNLLLENDSTDSEGYLYKGIALETKSKLHKAKDNYSNALKFNPNYGYAYYLRGLVEIKIITNNNQGTYVSVYGKKACQDLKKAIALGIDVNKLIELYCP